MSASRLSCGTGSWAALRERFRTLTQLLPVLTLRSFGSLVLSKLGGCKDVWLRVTGMPTPLYARLNNSDLSVFYQVFRLRECEVALVRPPRLIVDGGANVGYTTAFLAQRYPQATVIAIEPDEENCILLARNTQCFTNVRVIRGAIWPRSATLAIADQTQSPWMLQVREANKSDQATFPGITMSELLARYGSPGIDVLKLDIEGAEIGLFSAHDVSWIKHLSCLIIEVHGDDARKIVQDAMSRYGFECQASGEKLVFQRRSPSEQ